MTKLPRAMKFLLC